MSTLIEGVEAVGQPCALALLVPAGALVLVSNRHALVAAVGFLGGATLIAWSRFSGRWFATPSGPVAVLLGIVLLAIIVAVWRKPRGEVAGPSGVAMGAATAWLWEPCVGTGLGDVIDRAPNELLSPLWGTFTYMLGSTLPILALALLPQAFPKLGVWNSPRLVRAGGVLGLVIALTVAAGVYDDLVTELVVRSSA